MVRFSTLILVALCTCTHLPAQHLSPEIRSLLEAADSAKTDSIAYYMLESVDKKGLSTEELLCINTRLAQRATGLQKFSKATELTVNGITVARKEHLDSLEAVFNILAGINTYYLDRKKECIPYFEAAIDIAHKKGYWSIEARALHNAGGALADMKDFEKAERFLIASQRIREAHGEELSHLYLISMRILATIYERTGRDYKSEEIYQKLIALAEKSNDKVLLASNQIFYSQYLNSRKKLKEALVLSEDAVKNLTSAGDFHGLILAKQVHSKNLEDAGRYPEAIQLQKEAFNLQKQSFTENLEKQIGEMEVRFRTAEKENRIQLQSAQIKQERTYVIFLGIMIILLIVTGILLFSRYRLKAKQALQEERIQQEQLRTQSMIRSQEAERSRVSMELHDGLGQMLSAARLNLAAVGKSGPDPEIQKAIKLIDESCDELRNISHNLMPAVLIKSGLITAVKEMALKINHAGTISVFIENDAEQPEIPYEAQVNLFRIVQELLSNIIKYAGATEVHIQFTHEGNRLSVMIEDNGKGFDTALLRQSKGNGWNNIESRLQLMNGTIEIDSRPGNGTAVHLDIPIA